MPGMRGAEVPDARRAGGRLRLRKHKQSSLAGPSGVRQIAAGACEGRRRPTPEGPAGEFCLIRRRPPALRASGLSVPRLVPGLGPARLRMERE
jgi:hypothetical protein